ncbi:zinc finger protein 665-like [Phymastichus coffea]|uniref:zinc finger protein 665-like n=1 Tax=Phymastichus coffea TaxID=108790 RepID=UPI00273C628C|nr:zinc finger protein 665-like [Phymastichus coffea]
MMETVKICEVDLDEDICRLCLCKCNPDEVRQWGLFDTDLPQKLMAFAAVQLQENDGLPTLICMNCRNLVYTSYNFKCQVEKSDHDLRQALLLKQSSKDWQNITNVKPMEGLSNVDIIVPCYQKNFNSCMSMQDEHSANNHGQFIFEIENNCNLSNDTYKKEDVIVLNSAVNAVSQIENHALQTNNEISRPSTDNDVILTFGNQYEIRSNVLEKSTVENFQPQILQEKSNHSDDDKPLILRTKRHKCNYCIKSFANLNLLAKHAVIHKKTVYLCCMCNEEFNSMGSVQSHHITIHSLQVDKDKIAVKVKWPKVNNQEKNDDKSNENVVAQIVKLNEVNYSCEICYRQFTHYRTYSFHMKNHPDYQNKILLKNNHNFTTDKSNMHSGSNNSLQTKNIEVGPHLVNLNNSSDLEEFEHLSDPDSLGVKSSTDISQPTSVDLDLQASLENNFKENLCRIGSKNSLNKNTSENNITNFNDDYDDDDDDDEENDDITKNTDEMYKENSSIQCKQCGKLVATTRNLKRHMLTHSGLKHNCSICNKDFSRPDKLREHQQSKHKDEVFGKSDSENESDDENTGSSRKKDKKNRPYKCSICPKAFAQTQSLANHEERHKRDKDVQKRYLCEVCSKCFAQRGSLVAHMRTHTGVKPYVCNVCSRAFTKSTYLQLHLRIHSGEKPYVCQYCNRAFARANTLARHLTMHTGEAKYQCQICSKSFRRLTSLNEHTFTHTGQRPYSCKICGKRYNNAGSLYAHTKKCKTMQASTNMNDYPDALELADNAVLSQSENNSPTEQLLIFTEDKKDEIIADDTIAAEPSSCQFMIANIHDQKAMSVNMIEPFIIPEPDVYNINSKPFRTPYYGLYPSI